MSHEVFLLPKPLNFLGVEEENNCFALRAAAGITLLFSYTVVI